MDGAVEAAVLALARAQHGNVTRKQLVALGCSPAIIGYRVRNGRLHRVHRGVYSVGRPPATALERAAAAVLACGPGAALSHASALMLWGFVPRWRNPVHVSATGDRRPPRIVVHQHRGLTAADFRLHLGIRVTSPARTLLDCAPGLESNRVRRIAADAQLAGVLHPDALADVARRFPHHPGHALLLGLLDSSASPTRSGFEDAFIGFCRRFGLPRPEVNARVCGYEVDALFADARVIVELDGWAYHRGRGSFERDRNRDADTLLGGYVTVRITWERMHQTPGKEAKRLDAILRRRRGS